MKPIVKFGLVVACALILWSGLSPAEQTVSTGTRRLPADFEGAVRELSGLLPTSKVSSPALTGGAAAPLVEQQRTEPFVASSASSSSPTPPPPPPPSPVAATKALLPMPVKPCKPGCEKNGVCNTELGRCDCPPFMGGDDCAQPLFGACASAIGLKEVAAAPCVIDHMGSTAPVSCECLMGCEAMGLMGVRECYVMDRSNATVMDWVRQQRAARGLDANEQYWEANLKGAEALSVDKCGGRGVYAPPKPPQGAARGAARCLCYAGFGGARCESTAFQRPLANCLNGCSGRGSCHRNWCRCRPPFYGVDCSLGGARGADTSPALPPPIGAQTIADGAPRVYVYELPPEFNAWMQAGAGGWWQELDLWGEDVVFHKRMLRSTYRVTDPRDADYFVVPVWVSSAMWQMNWGFRDLLPTGVRTVRRLAQYLQRTWPYFDRRGGADHIWVFGHDQGAWRIRMKLPLIAKGIFLSPFGAGPAQRGGHMQAQDIVVPPLLYANVPLGLLNQAGRRRVAPPDLAFFQGKLNLHIPYEYSFGVRQGLYKAHRNTPRITIKEGHEANTEHYFEHMSTSKFCVAAAGFGFSTRAYEAALSGCVPLIMQDGVEQAFEELLPWGLFALRMNMSLSAIRDLPTTLDAIPEARVRAMRSVLYCVWPRLLWLRHDGAPRPLPDQQQLLKYDAFESVMWTLRKRLRKDIEWPADWEDGCRAVGRYFASPPPGFPGGQQWKPWALRDYDQKVLEVR